MKKIDLSPLKDSDILYEKIADKIKSSFKGEWDDPVHDSYDRYVKQIIGYSQKMRSIRSKAETLEKEVEALKIDELSQKTEALCREADLI